MTEDSDFLAGDLDGVIEGVLAGFANHSYPTLQLLQFCPKSTYDGQIVLRLLAANLDEMTALYSLGLATKGHAFNCPCRLLVQCQQLSAQLGVLCLDISKGSARVVTWEGEPVEAEGIGPIWGSVQRGGGCDLH